MKKSYRRRPRKLVITILVVSVILLFIILIHNMLRPVLQAKLAYQARVYTTMVVNQTVTEQLDAMDISYQKIVRVTHSGSGAITSLQADSVLINKIKSAITQKATENLVGLQHEELKIPLGLLTGVKLLAGKGPNITFHLYPQSVVETYLYHEFTDAGVNQTLHRVYMTLDVDILAIMPGFSVETTVQTNVDLGETVIVGEVPSVYGQMTLGE